MSNHDDHEFRLWKEAQEEGWEFEAKQAKVRDFMKEHHKTFAKGLAWAQELESKGCFWHVQHAGYEERYLAYCKLIEFYNKQDKLTEGQKFEVEYFKQARYQLVKDVDFVGGEWRRYSPYHYGETREYRGHHEQLQSTTIDGIDFECITLVTDRVVEVKAYECEKTGDRVYFQYRFNKYKNRDKGEGKAIVYRGDKKLVERGATMTFKEMLK